MNQSNQNEEQIVEKMKEGDSRAFQELYEKYNQQLYYFIFKIVKNSEESADIVQETFITVFKKATTLQDNSKFKSWLFQIALNNSRQYLRNDKEVLLDSDMNEDVVFESEAKQDTIPEQAFDSKATRELFMSMIDKLPDKQKLSVLLYYYEQYSIQEVAEIMECSENTVKSRLNYARKQIKAGVEDIQKRENIKLYNVGIAPLLYLLYSMGEKDAIMPESIRREVWNIISKKTLESTLNEVGKDAVLSGAENVANKKAGISLFGHTVNAKTGIGALLLLGTIVAATITFNSSKKDNTSETDIGIQIVQEEQITNTVTPTRSITVTPTITPTLTPSPTPIMPEHAWREEGILYTTIKVAEGISQDTEIALSCTTSHYTTALERTESNEYIAYYSSDGKTYSNFNLTKEIMNQFGKESNSSITIYDIFDVDDSFYFIGSMSTNSELIYFALTTYDFSEFKLYQDLPDVFSQYTLRKINGNFVAIPYDNSLFINKSMNQETDDSIQNSNEDIDNDVNIATMNPFEGPAPVGIYYVSPDMTNWKQKEIKADKSNRENKINGHTYFTGEWEMVSASDHAFICENWGTVSDIDEGGVFYDDRGMGYVIDAASNLKKIKLEGASYLSQNRYGIAQIVVGDYIFRLESIAQDNEVVGIELLSGKISTGKLHSIYKRDAADIQGVFLKAIAKDDGKCLLFLVGSDSTNLLTFEVGKEEIASNTVLNSVGFSGPVWNSEYEKVIFFSDVNQYFMTQDIGNSFEEVRAIGTVNDFRMGNIIGDIGILYGKGAYYFPLNEE